jgi:ADP-dependent NAD(P)H-hydrate dehydratase
VLAGIAGGIGARCGDATSAACWATLLHRGAARRAATRIGPLGYLARELNDELPGTLSELSEAAAVEAGGSGSSAARPPAR